MKIKLIITILVGMGLILDSFPGTAASPALMTGERLSEASSEMIWTRLAAGPELSDANGWSNILYYPTIQTADINGDSRTELLARDIYGMRAWRYMDEITEWVELKRGPDWSDATGWGNAPYNTTIQTADINGDGRAELLGRDLLGMQVWRYEDETTGWVELRRGPPLADAYGWSNLAYFSTIQTADINGDGRAELLARDLLGMEIWCYVDETTGWVALQRGPDWSDALGWSNMPYYATIQTGDIDGDGRAELLARDLLGMQAWHYVDETTGWVELKRGPAWPDGYGWENPQYYATIQTGDIDGDGRAELLARYVNGVLAWRYVDETKGWEELSHGPWWSDTASVRIKSTVYTWANPNQYATIQTGDINGDGAAELMGMDTDATEAWHYDGVTNMWAPLQDTPWSVWDGWGSLQYFYTIQTGDINGDGRAELLGRTSEGMEIWGWDQETPVSEALELVYIDEFDVKLVGSNVALYSPKVPDGYFALGDFSQPVHGVITGFTFAARELVPGALAAPIGYEWIWAAGYSVWRPIPPAGYVCLGLVAQPTFTIPSQDRIRCVRKDLTVPGRLGSFTGYDDVDIDYVLQTYRILPAFDQAIYFDTFAATLTRGPQILYALDSRAVKGVDPLTAQQIDGLIQDYGPIVYFHPDETYYMDDPAYVLDHGVTLDWAIVVNESSYDNFIMNYMGSRPTNSLTIQDDVSYVLNEVMPNPPYSSSPYYFRYWLNIPSSLWAGDVNQERSKAFVRVLPWNTFFTEIQFWFFYPYNGPGRFEVCLSSNTCFPIQLDQNGRHVGDWEHVSLRFENTSQKLISVYMSQHDGGGMFSANTPGLLYQGQHPVVFSAKYSHGNYPLAGTLYYVRVTSYDWELGTFSIDLFDLTGVGKSFETYQPGNYEVISSNTFPVREPDWLRYQSRWGQYLKNIFSMDFHWPFPDIHIYQYDEKEVSGGPSGPAMKSGWRTGDFADLFLLRDAPDIRYAWPKNPPLDIQWNFLYLPLTVKNP